MTELEAVTGVGPGAAKKLREAFITTAELLAVQNPVELKERTGLGEGTCNNIVENARILTGQGMFKSGLEIEKEQAEAPRLLTGVESVDKAILGGFPEGSIIEFYGPAKGGKTQWCSHLAVRAQLPKNEGGLEGRVLWIDTEGSFKTWIIRANAIRFGLDQDTTLGSINRAEFVTTGQIRLTFDRLPQLIDQFGLKLVIIDSFSGLYRAEFKGLSQLVLRQRELNTTLNTMRRIGSATGVTFIYTNQVQDKITQRGGMSNQPIGGHILSHGSDFRFYTTTKDKDRILRLKDNAGVPQFEETLKFGWGGFYDSIDAKKDMEEKIIETLESQDKLGFSMARKEILGEGVEVGATQ